MLKNSLKLLRNLFVIWATFSFLLTTKEKFFPNSEHTNNFKDWTIIQDTLVAQF